MAWPVGVTPGLPWKAAIIGLGKIGSRFDEEPARGCVWSHAGAYLARPRLFLLAGACETDARNAAAFAQRCPDVPVETEVASMLRRCEPAVVSICTPAESHAAVLREVLCGQCVRVVWCEKPLATSAADAAEMVAACGARGIPLVVSFVRRWVPVWVRARELAKGGAIGTVRVVRVAIPNRLWSMGSHAIDLIAYFGGTATEVAPFAVPDLREDGEPAVAAFFRFAQGGYGVFQVNGWRTNYLVEGEIVGDNGRLVVREDRSTIAVERFEPSKRYCGYREPAPPEIEHVDVPSGFSPFVAIVDEIAELLAGERDVSTCDGAAALSVQVALDRLAACG